MTAASRALVASAPTRLDFGGGWTDVPPYPEERGGFVCNIAIARRATVRLSAAPTAQNATAQNAHTPDALVGAALRRGDVRGVTVELASDFPVGAGLGGSSAAGVALAAAIHALRDASPSRETLAEWSRAVEVEEMGIAGGRQDHYAAAFGGALGLTFTDRTHVEPLPLDADTAHELERRCVLAYTGESRISSATITTVLDAYRDRSPRVVDALDRMASLARQMRDALVAADIESLGALVDEHWQFQRALHPGISTARIDAIARATRAAGALGMKALGASGGGCVIVFAPAGGEGAVRQALTGLAEVLEWGRGPAGRRSRSSVGILPAVLFPAPVPSRFPLDAIALTEALVAIDSRNPQLVANAPGESACAHFLAQVLSGWGFAVSVTDVAPGRPNVIARIGPTGHSPLILNGHLDVVGTDGMVHAPFEPTTDGDKLFGRGASDMKGGIAAMCVAAARAAARGALASEIIVTAVCDEEFESIGTRALLADGLSATGAIVTEPTRLAVCPAHKGFAWIEVIFEGHAAHGSRYDVGIDAVRHAGIFLAALDSFERAILAARRHPLLGRPSLHAAMIEGGSGWSTYAEQCRLRIERRTIPGESAESALAEVTMLCAELAELHDGFRATARIVFAQPPSDLSPEAPLTRAVMAAAYVDAPEEPIEGLACWTDAALFNAAGIPALCFGPGDIARAHSAEEWVERSQIERATMVLERVCAGWGR